MKSKKSFFRTVEPYLYLIPVMILFILFVFWPFVKTIQLSFARTTPLGQVAQYVGLDNYTNIFTDGTFLNSLVTTLKFSVMRVTFLLCSVLYWRSSVQRRSGQRDFSVLYMHFRWLFPQQRHL